MMDSISIRTQYHFRQSEKGLLAWDVRKLIEASKNLPIVEVPLSAIEEIDQQYWYDLGGAVPTCRNIAEHAELIHKADLSFPILMDCDGKVFDGMHRVSKALLLGQATINARKFPAWIPPDFTGIDVDQLFVD